MLGPLFRFCGKGASDFVIPPDPKPKPEKMTALGVPLNSIESWGRKNLRRGERVKLPDHRKNPDGIFEFTEMTELPENIFDSSDDEISDQAYARIGDAYYNGFLTSKQKKKEERLARAYVEDDKDRWEFYGKGSSDFEFLLWPPPNYQPPASKNQPPLVPLKHPEESTKKKSKSTKGSKKLQ
ncbi:hypothetical protein AVEN_162382-1 [Araneus ventricosus]|uniref:Uncharacterized protein n=1 Tax=Araneus ventricosus TaxID=182803 RepID=A0A4Y2GH06_ARAVE|nr:hypothetical protein AVEN_162382-1 [Araneus ventricosus]